MGGEPYMVLTEEAQQLEEHVAQLDIGQG